MCRELLTQFVIQTRYDRNGLVVSGGFRRQPLFHKALSTLSQKSATVAEFGDCRRFLAVFGDSRTFL